jgi:long-chain acyl-CoA synthetase
MTVTRLFDIPAYQAATHPLQTSLAEKVNGAWKPYSTADVIHQINLVSRGLMAMGLQPGDTIAIVSNNRPQWNFVDLGAQQIGVVVVPLYPTITENDYRYILNHAEAKKVFVSDRELYGKMERIRADVPSLRTVYTFDEIPEAPSWREVVIAAATVPQEDVEARKAAVQPTDLATIIYTSGTTGTPKGVMLSHRNVLSNIQACLDFLPVKAGHRSLSFLPLCHIFERMVLYVYLYTSVSVHYAESMDTIGPNITEVKPHFFTTVPRLLEKVYEKIAAKAATLGSLKRLIFRWSIGVGLQYNIQEDFSPWYRAQLWVARKLVFDKWYAALGGNLVGIVTGAAPLNPRMCKLFSAAGIAVREGYGQTEAAPAISFNRFEKDDAREGTIGIPIPGIEVKVDELGEICCRGENVMLGYYKSPEETAKAIDADGWLHTGDVGEWEDGRFLKITDRLKEIFKTSNGKYVAPQPIENAFKESFYIEQMMVVGENRKFTAALIVPSFVKLAEWCAEHHVPWDDNDRAKSLAQPKILELYEKQCARYNERFSQTEKVKRFVLMPEEWTVEGGELTPTMKPRRKPILEKYAPYVEGMYREG